MNLLTLVQTFCQRTGINVPTQVVGSTDPQVIQLLALLNEVVEDIVDRKQDGWQELQLEATFTTVAAEIQGSLTTIAPFGFVSIINDTIYNRSQRLQAFGPLTPQEYQYQKSVVATGPFYQYRLQNNQIHLFPVPPAGETYAFEYLSTYAVVAVDGTTFKAYFSADTDTFRLDERLLLRGLRWKWKKEKGLEYDEEFREFEDRLANASGRNKTNTLINMAQGQPQIKPGVFIPSGNWNLP